MQDHGSVTPELFILCWLPANSSQTLSYIWVLLLAHPLKWSASSIKLFFLPHFYGSFIVILSPIKISDSPFKAAYISAKWKEGGMRALNNFRDVSIVSFIFNLHKLCAFPRLNVVKKKKKKIPPGTGTEHESESGETGELTQSGCVPVGAMRWGATVFFTEHKLMIVRRCWIAVCHRALVHPPVTGDNKSRGAVLPRKRFAWQIDSNSSYMRIHFFTAKDISAKEKKKNNLLRYSCQLTPLREIFAYRPAQLCSHNVSGVSLPPVLVSGVICKLGRGWTRPRCVDVPDGPFVFLSISS